MTHVWQAQTRGRFYLPLMRHPFCRYAYELVDGRPFGRYGLEQQAEIVRHRFLADAWRATSAQLPDRRFPAVRLTISCYQQIRNSLVAKALHTPLFAGAQ